MQQVEENYCKELDKNKT